MSEAVARFRNQKKRAGFVRVEAQVRAEDAGTLRQAAKALTDPIRGRKLKAFLAREFPETIPAKDLLASAPLDGIKLTRSRDTGRKVKF
jgi:hypothetical protein